MADLVEQAVKGQGGLRAFDDEVDADDQRQGQRATGCPRPRALSAGDAYVGGGHVPGVPAERLSCDGGSGEPAWLWPAEFGDAKRAEGAFRISLARRSPAFSRLSRLIEQVGPLGDAVLAPLERAHQGPPASY